jgi:hypothetical protein
VTNDARLIMAQELSAQLRRMPVPLAEIVANLEVALTAAGYRIAPIAEQVTDAVVRHVTRYPCTCAGRRGCMEHPFGNPLPDWRGVDTRATG